MIDNIEKKLLEEVTTQLTEQFRESLQEILPSILEDIRESDWHPETEPSDDQGSRKFMCNGAIAYLYKGRIAACIDKVCFRRTMNLCATKRPAISIDLNQPELSFAETQQLPDEAQSWRQAWRNTCLDALMSFCNSMGLILQLDFQPTRETHPEPHPFAEWNPLAGGGWKYLDGLYVECDEYPLYYAYSTCRDGARQFRASHATLELYKSLRHTSVSQCVHMPDSDDIDTIAAIKREIDALQKGVMPQIFELPPDIVIQQI